MRIPLSLRHAAAVHRANALQRRVDELRATVDLLSHELAEAKRAADLAREQAAKLAERVAQ